MMNKMAIILLGVIVFLVGTGAYSMDPMHAGNVTQSIHLTHYYSSEVGTHNITRQALLRHIEDIELLIRLARMQRATISSRQPSEAGVQADSRGPAVGVSRFLPSLYYLQRAGLITVELLVKIVFVFLSGPIPAVGGEITNVAVDLTEHMHEITGFAVANMAESIGPAIESRNRPKYVFLHSLWMIAAVPALWALAEFISEHANVHEGLHEPTQGAGVFFDIVLHGVQYTAALIIFILYIVVDEFFAHHQQRLKRSYQK